MTTTTLIRRRGVAAWVTARELGTWIDEGRPLTLVDVRTPDQYGKGHVPGCVNIPDSAPQHFVKRIPRDEITVLVCANGTQSDRIARTLDYCDYSKVVFLDGGLTAWRAEGFATERAARQAAAGVVRECAGKTEVIRRTAGAITARLIGAALAGAAGLIALTVMAFAR